jgi:hypothetical protein
MELTFTVSFVPSKQVITIDCPPKLNGNTPVEAGSPLPTPLGKGQKLLISSDGIKETVKVNSIKAG